MVQSLDVTVLGWAVTVPGWVMILWSWALTMQSLALTVQGWALTVSGWAMTNLEHLLFDIICNPNKGSFPNLKVGKLGTWSKVEMTPPLPLAE